MNTELPRSQIPSCASFTSGCSVLVVGDATAWTRTLIELISVGCVVRHTLDIHSATAMMRSGDRRTLVILCDALTYGAGALPQLWHLRSQQATLFAPEAARTYLHGIADQFFELDCPSIWLLPALWLRYPVTCHARHVFACRRMREHPGVRDFLAHLTFCCPDSASEVGRRLFITGRSLHRRMRLLNVTFHDFCQRLRFEVVEHTRSERSVKLSTLADELACCDAHGLSRSLRSWPVVKTPVTSKVDGQAV